MLAVILLSAVSVQTSPDDFPKLWQDVSKAIETRFYDRKKRHDELEALLAKTKPKAEGATSREAFARAVNDMIAEFGDSHFAFTGDDQQGFYLMDGIAQPKKAKSMPNVGAWFKESPDGYTVQMVVNGSAAEKADLHKGDKIESADGQPFRPVASFDGKGNVTLSILRDGQRLEKQLSVSNGSASDMFLEGTRSSVRVIDRGGKKFGYVHLWLQTSDDFRNALSSAVYGPLRDTDGFILDLRDGFGGRPEGFADPFFRPDIRLEWQSPGGTFKELFGYQRPLVVLINGGSRSAKEVLSQILQKSRRATLVGSATAGNVLGTYPQKISDWAYLEIPMVDVISDGVRLEGHGVQPDVPVAQEFDASGKDLYLEKALEILAK